MKNLMIFTLALFISSTLSAQSIWQISGGTNIHTNSIAPPSMRVGINTISPSAKLEIKSDPTLSPLILSRTDGTTIARFGNTPSGVNGTFTLNDAAGNPRVSLEAGGANVFNVSELRVELVASPSPAAPDFMKVVTNNNTRGFRYEVGAGADFGAFCRLWSNDGFGALTLGKLPTSMAASLLHTTGGWQWTSQLNISYTPTSGSYTLTVGGEAYASVGWFSPSDLRLKRDIEPMSNSLEILKELKGVKYYYNTGIGSTLPTDQQIGIIAQDLQKVLPELVKEGPNDHLAVNYDGLIPVLIEAIKDQQGQIDELSEKLHLLATQNNTVSSESNKASINAFPNPTNGNITVTVNSDSEVLEAFLLTYEGVQLRQITFDKNLSRISMQDYASGNYIISVRLKDGTSVATTIVRD